MEEYITQITGRYLIVDKNYRPVVQKGCLLVVYPDIIDLSKLRDSCVEQTCHSDTRTTYQWKYKILILSWKQYMDVSMHNCEWGPIATKIKEKQKPWDHLYEMSNEAQSRIVIALS